MKDRRFSIKCWAILNADSMKICELESKKQSSQPIHIRWKGIA